MNRIKPNLFEGRAGSVEFDQVESIEIDETFSGHVYNLETETNKYIASNIVVSNCCRPSVIKDIEESKPVAIFGLSNTALSWINRPSGVYLWRGRRTPVKIGTHVCWFYPMLHPSDILSNKGGKDWRKSDDEIAFEFDVKRAIAEIEIVVNYLNLRTYS